MGVYFDIGYMVKSLPVLLSYVHITLGLTAAALAGGLAASIFLAMAVSKNIPVLAHFARVYISFMRGTPFLVQLFLFYFGLPELLIRLGVTAAHSVPGIVYVALVFAMHVGGYGAEILRTAILAVPSGQLEAALSCGLSEWQAYRQVVFPQAFLYAIPLLANQFLGLIKGTSIVFVISVVEILGAAKVACAESYRYLETYLAAALIYWAFSIVFEYMFAWAERYWGTYRRGRAQLC
ncbi:MAG: amino acid ABC transporter permease [Selenomonas sp.]|nr:amino acid ABC transporter permease [Selenomonas sp.]